MVKKVTFQKITQLVKWAKEPLQDEFLENLQEKHFGEFRHNYYRFLYHLVLFRKPKLALEIGIDQGIASMHMCAAAKSYGGQVVGIDINKPLEPIPYDNFIFLNMDSTRVNCLDIAKPNELGVVFQDSSHHYDQSVKEWNIFTDPNILDKNCCFIHSCVPSVELPSTKTIS